jgi:methylase of polypeptide subunit release factors
VIDPTPGADALDALPGLATRLAAPFRGAGFTVEGVAEALGEGARAALDRGEPEPAARAVGEASPLATLVRLFLLGEARPVADVAAAIAPVGLDEAVDAGLLARGDGAVVASLDLRPHADDHGSWWVVSDLELRPDDPADAAGSAERAREHVLGTGAASLSLARATVRRPVATLLDLGAGCGVQTLHASGHAAALTATDVSARALALARATFALSGIDAEVLAGPWWEPVAGRRFDQIVCNPPFVPGPPEVEHVYRDAGLGGDGASDLLVSTLPGHLAQDGVGQLLASWLVTRPDVEAARAAGGADGGGTDGWDARPRRWLAAAAEAAEPGGLDAWVVQRDVADPALHVGTWLRDAGVDPASSAGRERSARWLDFFAAHDVVAIGFGFVTLRRTAPGVGGTLVCEDMRQAHGDPLGPEVEAWLDRVAWLREHDLLDEALVVPPTTALERGYAPVAPEDVADGDEDGGGWRRIGGTLVRLDGPQWRHDLDELGEALLAGCRGHLPLRDLCELLALAHGRDPEELTAAALPVVRELFLHGMVVPR